MTTENILLELKSLSNATHLAGMSRYGIDNSKAYGVKTPDIRKLAKKLGRNHKLALELWKTDVHEARMLAAMLLDTKLLTNKEFDALVSDFDSWDMCDCTCSVLHQSPFAVNKITEYADNQNEFVKRTAFVLMCTFAVHHKDERDDFFYPFLEIIEREAWDERNFVKKAVNWALRQIGKRNNHLRIKAIETAKKIKLQNTPSARWIANDALRELNDTKIVQRLVEKDIKSS
ncbi:MAG: DNA alkylation repair protein [Paludibacteraceae bacterium]